MKKAAANIVVLHPHLGEVEVWNTHVSEVIGQGGSKVDKWPDARCGRASARYEAGT